MAIDPQLGDGFRSRLRDTYLAPSRLALALRDRGPWLDVLLVSTVVALVSVALMPDEVFTASMQEPVSRRGDPVQITSSPESVARWGRGMGVLATIATHPLLAFTLAGILTLLFTILGNGHTGFREYLSLAAHGMLIPALGTLIAVAVRLGTGATSGSLSVTAFFDPAEAQNLFTATLFSIDPFIIWMMAAVAVGVHALEPRHSRAAAAAVLVGGYIVLVIASTALLHPELLDEVEAGAAADAALVNAVEPLPERLLAANRSV
ncbi:MAG: hypothetical protein WD766_00610 [Gemmatimonadota bacterium]